MRMLDQMPPNLSSAETVEQRVDVLLRARFAVMHPWFRTHYDQAFTLVSIDCLPMDMPTFLLGYAQKHWGNIAPDDNDGKSWLWLTP